MSHDHGVPPSDWPGLEMTVARLTDDIYFGWLTEEPTPTFWHWCAALEGVPPERKVFDGCWVAAGTSAHTLVSREPLHLEPSLLWRCCGLHGWVRGWVRGGRWIPA